MDTTAQDPQAWQDYRARLLAFVRKRVGDPSDAEDLVHDVLARAYARRDSLKDQSRLSSWLFQITRNAVADYYRSRRPQEELSDEIPSLDGEEAKGASEELARCLVPFVERLPTPYREAVEYAEIEGLTQRETATKLGLSHSGAKSRVQRARAMLEAELLACCHVEFDSRGSISEYEPKGSCEGC